MQGKERKKDRKKMQRKEKNGRMQRKKKDKNYIGKIKEILKERKKAA